MSHFIALHSVGVRYRGPGTDIEALRDVNLTFSRGQSTAVLGRSGSGKSTLVSLLGLMRSPTTGTLTVAGVDVVNQDRREIARLRSRNIGMVFQSFHLNPSLTAAENVALPWLVGARRMRRSHSRDRARESLEAVGLGGLGRRSVATLSGGERQRVAVARALFSKPKILIADEPTGNLDEANANAVSDLLYTLARSHGTCVVVVTHDRAVAAQADRIVRIERGAVVG